MVIVLFLTIPVSSSKTDRADFIARSFFLSVSERLTGDSPLTTARLISKNKKGECAPRHGDAIAEGSDIADAVWYFVAHAKNTTGAERIVDCGSMIQLYPVIPR